MMKKTYIQPTTLIVALEHQSICGVSEFNEQLGDTTNGVNGSAALVKGDRMSRDTYNVWNDDWSQQ